jgi:Asp-tRNA(Asn)/Glu-tRNA(Gln) amidotransferase A subunit family amidase
MSTDFHHLSAAAAARCIAAGEITSEALVTSCLDRIAARDRDVQAWAALDIDFALKQAARADREAPRSPLHGVPIGIKDVIDTGDLPTEYNSPIYHGHRPRADAACVSALRRAGCVILGKTVSTEFATSQPAHTRNPHNYMHTPGGSSSGSAAAVADHMVPLGLGTQTGGSTIRPASYCGCVGYKPSYGTINRAGLKPLAESLDTIGVLARSVEDAALCVHVIAGRALPQFDAPQLAAPRVGICRTPCWHEADSLTQATIERVASLLSATGASVADFELPPNSERLFDEHAIIMDFEAARALGWELQHHADQISARLRARLEGGWEIARTDYDRVREIARTCRHEFAKRMRDFDFLITPGAQGEAPATLETTGDAVFNRAWTLLGVPCVTLPAGTGSHGLPLGVQLVGRFDHDADLLVRAHRLESRLA